MKEFKVNYYIGEEKEEYIYKAEYEHDAIARALEQAALFKDWFHDFSIEEVTETE